MSNVRHFPIRLLLILLVFLLACPPPSPAATRDERADLETFRTDYIVAERAYTDATRTEALRRVSVLEQGDAPLGLPALFLGLSEIIALADNPHSHLMRTGPMASARRLPIRMVWLHDALVVVRALAEQRDLVGGTVLAIGGRPVRDVFDRMLRYVSGPDEARRGKIPTLLEVAGLARAGGGGGDDDALPVTVRRMDGTTVSRRLAFADVAGPSFVPISRLLAPEPFRNDATEWITALSAERTPPSLRSADELYRRVGVPGLDVLYLQFRANYETVPGTMANLLTEAQNALKERSRPVVIDERFNEGGDTNLTAVAFARIVQLAAPHRIYVLVGPDTGSAAIASAAIIKRRGGERTVIIGAGLGDRLRFWSEPVRTCLPRSGLCMWHSVGLWDLERGCAGESACMSTRYDAVVGSLEPDIAAPWDAASYLAGRDPAIEVVRRDLQR
jgi:hypothetical protein